MQGEDLILMAKDALTDLFWRARPGFLEGPFGLQILLIIMQRGTSQVW